MSKLPIGIVDTTQITHNLINLSNQSVARRENVKLNNELSSIYQRVDNYNRLLANNAPAIARYLGYSVKSVGVMLRHMNPARPHCRLNVMPLDSHAYDLNMYSNNKLDINFLHSTDETYSLYRYQNSYPTPINTGTLQNQRDIYINGLAWSTLAYIKRFDVDYIDAAVDFALSELNTTSQYDFSERVQRRVELICTESLNSGHNWIQDVFKYHAKYDSTTSIKPIKESIPDISLLGVIARSYEYDLVNKKTVSKEESIAIAESHHPMVQESFHLPSKITDVLTSSSVQPSNMRTP
ncbi:hypothetical protein GCM10011607_28410 [Shewanella inventionis]|uniref:Uncharacterized protein n=1 Tax=Shewanella inventionis TaxID=1738770 RepID=A0ABQ1JDA0_9GAMM|nr:hypothetical protein [Shewanella inventionis]GGB66034.1 hypothetical protein GCM10011607_28410 [Shewanella inventionis]